MERPERPRRHRMIQQRQTPRPVLCPRPTRLFDVNVVSESDSDTDSPALSNIIYANCWPERPSQQSGLPSTDSRQVLTSAEAVSMVYDQPSQSIQANTNEEYDPMAPSFTRSLPDPGPSTSSGSRILQQFEQQFFSQMGRPFLSAKRRALKRSNASPLRMDPTERDTLLTQQRGFFQPTMSSSANIPFLDGTTNPLMDVSGPYNVLRQINSTVVQRQNDNNEDHQYSSSQLTRPSGNTILVCPIPGHNDPNRFSFEPRSPVLEPRSPDYPPHTPPPSSPNSSNSRSQSSNSRSVSPQTPVGEPTSSPLPFPPSPPVNLDIHQFREYQVNTDYFYTDERYIPLELQIARLSRSESSPIPLSPSSDISGFGSESTNIHLQIQTTPTPVSPIAMEYDRPIPLLVSANSTNGDDNSSVRTSSVRDDVSVNRDCNNDIIIIDHPERNTTTANSSAVNLATSQALNLVKTSVKSMLASKSLAPITSKSDYKNSSQLQELNQGLISLLECPVCMELIEPPIMQCNKGHLVCADCRPKLIVCPTCRCRMADRNLAMEKVAEKLLYPCKFSTGGCAEMVHLKDKAKHEGSCGFKQFDCLFVICPWKGYKPELLVHLTERHKEKLINGNSKVISAAMDDIMGHYVFHTYDELFLVSFNTYLTTRKFFCAAQIIGSPEKATKYVLNLKLQREKFESMFKFEQHFVEVFKDSYRAIELFESDMGIKLDLDVLKTYKLNHMINLSIKILHKDKICAD